MALRTRVEPDCSGRCACSQTDGHSAIAAITGARKSFGCGLVKRIRSIPSTASQARSSSSNELPTSRPYELTFWPSSVSSLTPARARPSTSARISPGRRDTSRPRTDGTMQYEQAELQPIEICTQAWKRRSRCSGSRPANARSSAIPNAPRSTPSPPAPRPFLPPRPQPLAEVRDRARPEGDVDVRVEREQPLALRLGVAAADGDHLLRLALLQRPCLGEVRGEALVGLLADRAGVEDEHVGLRLFPRLAEPELFEHALDPLRVVRVHLAPEGRHVVAPHGDRLAPVATWNPLFGFAESGAMIVRRRLRAALTGRQ